MYVSSPGHARRRMFSVVPRCCLAVDEAVFVLGELALLLLLLSLLLLLL